MEKYIKTKNSKDFTDTVIYTYRRLNKLYGPTARITSMFELFRDAFEIEEFLVFDPRFCQNGTFQSWLMDRQKDWMEGREVDFNEVFKAILEAGDFTKQEQRSFILGDAPERIWAIFLAVCDPGNTNNI